MFFSRELDWGYERYGVVCEKLLRRYRIIRNAYKTDSDAGMNDLPRKGEGVCIRLGSCNKGKATS